jgi:hypothetical protein
MNETRVKLHYGGSLFWLIFWAVVFFPVALVLLLTSAQFDLNDCRYIFKYDGSRGWLAFWVVVCFPLAFVLLFYNGFTFRSETRQLTPATV